MFERQSVPVSGGRQSEDRSVEDRLQWKPSTQLTGQPDTQRVRDEVSGTTGVRTGDFLDPIRPRIGATSERLQNLP
jgi:hypothetical protein